MWRVIGFGYVICVELFRSRRRRSRGEPRESTVANALSGCVVLEATSRLAWMFLPPKIRLVCASILGRVRDVRRQIQNGADVNWSARNGLTSLLWASLLGRVEVVRVLLENGADVNRADNKRGWTALMVASYVGHINVVRVLVEKGADVNRADNSGETALDIASANSNVGVIRVLTTANARSNDPNTTLQELANLVHEHGQSMPEDVYAKLNASLQRAWRDTRR